LEDLLVLLLMVVFRLLLLLLLRLPADLLPLGVAARARVPLLGIPLVPTPNPPPARAPTSQPWKGCALLSPRGCQDTCGT